MKHKQWPSREEVLKRLFSAWKPTVKTEVIPVDQAIGRIAAANIRSAHGLPVVRASSMDGIGVTAAMFQNGIPDMSQWRPGREYVRADTGDDFADKYDAVIPIEAVTILPGGGIQLKEPIVINPQMNIRPHGSFFTEDELLVKRWTKLTPSDLAVLVMGGIKTVSVTVKPTAAFIPTGSELIPAGAEPARGKNIDSNTILVKHMLLEMGAKPLCFPIVKDVPADLKWTLEDALQKADFVIINGGSSKGEEDFNADLLKEKGEVLCHNAAAAPGRPICAAIIDGKPVINLPGPPVACYYGMDWCIRAVVNAILHQAEPERKTIPVRLAEDICYDKGMEILCKMELWKTPQGYEGRQVPFRASTIVENLAAPGHFITDPDTNCHKAGEILEVELLREERELYDGFTESSPYTY